MTTTMTSQLSIATSFRNTEKENLYRLQYYIKSETLSRDVITGKGSEGWAVAGFENGRRGREPKTAGSL